MAAAVAALVIGVATWQLTGGDEAPKGPKTEAIVPPAVASPATKKLQISSVQGISEQTSMGGPDSHVGNTAHFIKDKKPNTYFETENYKGQYVTTFGNLLKGAGVVLDLGASKQVSKVVLHAPGTSVGAHVEVYVGDDDNRSLLSTLGSETLAGTTTEISGKTLGGRYVILWFTKSPPTGKLQIGEATVHGTE